MGCTGAVSQTSTELVERAAAYQFPSHRWMTAWPGPASADRIGTKLSSINARIGSPENLMKQKRIRVATFA